jgi:cell division transport system ATP-binding protein
LADVSLTLDQGRFYTVTGAAGAGKTTLLGIVSLAVPPSEGRLTLFGNDVAQLDRNARALLRRRIGIMFQDLRLIDRLTVRDNISLPLRINGAPAQQIDSDVSELLAWLDLANCADRRAATLSASERRLTALARAIVGRPQLLVADEPAGGGDRALLARLMHIFEQVHRIGATVLIATQSAAFDEIAQHRYVLERGRLAGGDSAAVQ